MSSKSTLAIIGSGLASSILARLLHRAFDVTIFERGSAAPAWPQRHVESGHRLGLFPSYGHGLGGTTHYWAGGLMPLRPAECGDKWPAGLPQQLEAYENDVVSLLYGARAGDEWAKRVLPLQDGPFFVDYILRPCEAFNAAHRHFFDGVDVKLRHEVLSLKERDGGVVVKARADSAVVEETFDLAIVAAGNFGSPLILARSGLGGPCVGQNVTDHPMGYVAKLTAPGANRFQELEIVQGENFALDPLVKVRDEATGLWTSLYLRPTKTSAIYSDPYQQVFETLAQTNKFVRKWKALKKFGNADFRAQAISYATNKSAHGNHVYLMAVAEQEHEGQGVIRQSGDVADLDWKISDAVVESIRRSVLKVADWSGGTQITWPEGDMRDRLWSAAHHSGGCRMSEDATSGVVDRDLRVHGAQAIYVCDGSVLPSTGGTNTGLAIGCLAMNLVKHLAARSASHAPAAARAADLLITGFGGRLGHMLAPQLERDSVAYRAASLRSDASAGVEKVEAVLHLANDGASVEENARVQRKARALVDQAAPKRVIVPMSSATIQSAGPNASDPAAFNFGFDAPLRNAYVVGKLEAERFWLDWQQEDPTRELVLLYIPTITGPHSVWTHHVAGHLPGMVMWSPVVPRFFSVSEGALMRFISGVMQTPFGAGVHRIMIYDRSDSLAETLAAERGAPDVRQAPVPYPLFRLARQDKLRKAMFQGQRVFNKVLKTGVQHQIAPFDLLDFTLYTEQSRCADAIVQAAKRSRRELAGASNGPTAA